jgi:hypothetical protein
MIKTIKEFINRCVNIESCDAMDFTDRETAKFSLLIIMWHVVHVANGFTVEEREYVLKFFKDEFKMTESETDIFIAEVKENTPAIEEHIELIKSVIYGNAYALKVLLEHINKLINCDKIQTGECEFFTKIQMQMMK